MTLGVFLVILLLGLPLFALIAFEKSVDLHSYRKLGMTDKIKKHLMLELLILIVAQVLNAVVASLILVVIREVLFLLVFPPLPVLSFIPMYLWERKSIPEASQKHSLKIRSFVADLILTSVYLASCTCFTLWWLSSYLGEADILFGGDNLDVNAKWGGILFVGSILLVVVFALIKIIVQKVLVKRASTIAAKG